MPSLSSRSTIWRMPPVILGNCSEPARREREPAASTR
jgi:hypothetical protein